VLGQAKGILMQRDGLTAPQAFQLLVRASQDTNMKIADVARWLITETEINARDQRPTGCPRPPSQPRPSTTGHRPRTVA
jgi:hypothetical protein